MEKYIDVETVRTIAHDYLCVQQDEDAFMEEISNAATSDVATVRRTIYKYYNGYCVARCVNCRCAIDIEWSYCPECGGLIDHDAPECGSREED